ncbi:hypothetical protein BGAL_0486g00080 [Botrytis galanthina]|uniref:Uncharacterized protein n=1 Tax=Botrytis galanthina TaxID=278940 RepID=A0A4S8QP65_9HELO|nr:hypothetical protein BGAL_0486g00080 [Botrytis galanthina]
MPSSKELPVLDLGEINNLCAASPERLILEITQLKSNEEKTNDDIFEKLHMVSQLLKDNPRWWRNYYTEEGFITKLECIQTGLEQNIPRIRERRTERINYIHLAWGHQPQICAWVSQTQHTSNFLFHLAKVAKRFPNYMDAVDRLNDALITRLLTSQRGSRTEKKLQSSDCIKALKIDKPQLHLEETYRPLGLAVNEATGLLAVRLAQTTTPILSSLSNRSQGSLTYTESIELPLELEAIRELSPQERAAGVTSEESSLSEIESVASSTFTEATESESVKEETLNLNQCKCTIPFRDRLIRIYQEHAWRTLTPSVKRDIYNMLSLVLKRLPDVCARHQRNMAVLVGLKIKHISQPELHKRLRVLDVALRSGDTAFNELVKGKQRSWFTAAYRPYKEKDALGHYRFARQGAWPVISLKERLEDEKFSSDILDLMLSPNVIGTQWDYHTALRIWKDQGSVNIPLFKWWWSFRDAGLARIIDDEFDMYKHHTRWDLFGNENKGWLVTAYYTIAQQLASQDPVHYAVYTALRPDHCTQLISYPYYAKYSEYEEGTENPASGGFEHIDHNINKLLQEVDGISSQIQGSVSLDDEAAENCTKIVPGFHKVGVLKEWWESVPEEKKKGGPVTRIETPMKWEPVPCRQGEARITMPQIPHGAYPRYPGMKRRRCVFTWLTKINADQKSLANTMEGAGTAQDITLARVSCTRPKTTPAGKHINNSKLPYKFPACVRLASLGAISDALIGLRLWDAPEVIAEQEVLFGNDKTKALQYIMNWRQQAYTAAHEAFHIISKTEQEIFKGKSYWKVGLKAYSSSETSEDHETQ